jgi:hypothetical protein
MSTARVLSVAIMVALLAGCAITVDYPRCYLFRAPDDTDIARVDQETGKAIAGTFRTLSHAVTRDVVAIKAPRWEQAHIRQAWPGLGCVNLRREPPLNAEIVDKWIVQRCQDYVAALLQRAVDRKAVARTSVAEGYTDFICH